MPLRIRGTFFPADPHLEEVRLQVGKLRLGVFVQKVKLHTLREPL